MKYLVLALVFFTASVFSADYRRIGSTNNLEFFVDQSTLKYDKENNSWQFVLKSVLLVSSPDKAEYSLEQALALCKERIFITGSAKYFSKAGELVDTADTFDVYTSYATGSLAHAAVEGLCGEVSKSPANQQKLKLQPKSV